MKKLTLLFIFLTGITLSIHAQNPQWLNYTNGDFIHVLATEGNTIWIGTNGGLVGYDIVTGTKEYFNKANCGLPVNNVTAIAVEENGIKWIGIGWPSPGGLVAFDGISCTVYNEDNSGLPVNNVTAIAIEEDGTKWIATYSGGLAAFDGNNWTVYNTSNSFLPSNNVNSIAIEEDGTKWIGTEGGLAAFDGSSWVIYNAANSGLPINGISSIAIDGNGAKWIGTHGLATFDNSNWMVYDTANSELPANFVTSIAIDGNGTKWIGTAHSLGYYDYGDGLTSFDDSTWTVYNTSNSGLLHDMVNDILSITIEEDGTKWIGTEDGLASFDGSNWSTINTSNSGLPGNWVTALAIDWDGTKWISPGGVNPDFYFGLGLTTFDGSNWTVYNTSNSGLPSGKVNAFAFEPNGTKWIGTSWGGLAAYDDFNWTVYNTTNSGLPSNTIRAIATEGNGTKWIGTYVNGIVSFDGSNWTTSYMLQPVTSISIDQNGITWFGTDGGGLYGNGEVYNTSNSGLPTNYIYSIAVDGNGTKWIGTKEGLVAFDGTDWTVYDTTNSGLTGNQVYSIAIEGNGTKWIGNYTNNLYAEIFGLTSFNDSTWTTYNTTNSGLPDDRVYTIAVDEYGTKWIGTASGGLAAFNEDGIPVGVEELAVGSRQSAVNVYPNPADNYFTLVSQSDIDVTLLEIINIQGKVVMHQAVTNNKQSYNISHLPNGMYFIRIHTSKGIEVKKLVIQ